MWAAIESSDACSNYGIPLAVDIKLQFEAFAAPRVLPNYWAKVAASEWLWRRIAAHLDFGNDVITKMIMTM